MTKAPGSTVLITGGAGFIGSHTADALIDRGYKVRILDLLDPQVHGSSGCFPAYLNSSVECMRGDVCNESDVRDALDGVSYVFHCAALTGVGQSMYDVRKYVDVNVGGTSTLIETIAKNRLPIKKLVLSSSRAVYGEGTHSCRNCGIVYPPTRKRMDMEQDRFDVYCPTCSEVTKPALTSEDRPLKPISIYGWTKKQQEDLWNYGADIFGLPTVALRYFNVYGSRQSLTNPYTGIVSIFHGRIVNDQSISIYERGIPVRDFVHVSDVVQANLLSMNPEIPPGSYNIGTGIGHTVREVALALSRVIGREPTFDDRGEFRVGDIHSCVADLSTSARVLGYKPETDLQDGMKEFGRWALGQRSGNNYSMSVDQLKEYGLFGTVRTTTVADA